MHEMFVIINHIRRAALEKWKQRLGPEATYKTLIASFEHAGYSGYAETVRNVARVGHGKYFNLNST